jgi:hypothetical protein
VRERVLRFAVLRRAPLRGFAAAVDRLAVARFGAALLREAAAPLDFARVVRDFAAVVFFADVVLRAAGFRRAAVFRGGFAAAAGASSVAHLPDMKRCAASATASAISEPSLVALEATLLAACCAVSAASSPASRILRRAAGLALIAAAAAARPAASISLLIAALASLSTVLLPELEVDLDELARPDDDREVDLDELFLGDFAMAFSPLSVKNDSTAVTVPWNAGKWRSLRLVQIC